MRDLVSILVPTLGRPEKLARLLRLIRQNTTDYPDYEVIVRWDRPIPENRGCPTTLHEAYQAAHGTILAYMGNDCLPQPGWLRIAMEAMRKHFPDMDGLVSLADGYWKNAELPLHFIIGRKLVERLGGEIFHVGYAHTCCDSELGARAKQLNKFVWCPEALVLHDHPILLGEKQKEAIEADPVYRWAYDPARRQRDCDLLLERAKRYGFPIRENFSPPRIPRKIWACWLGDAPRPPLVEKCLASQREFTKGYQWTLITDENRPQGIPYVEAAIAARRWVKAVDYLKLHYLYTEGGVYMDADVELLKPFPDEFLTDRLFAGRERNGWIGNGVIGAEPGHPVLARCLERVNREFRGDDDKNFESSVQLFTETAHGMGLEQYGVKIYPPQVFTPYDHQGKKEEITEDTVAFHHFLVSWGYPKVHPSIDLRRRLPAGIDQMTVLNIGLGRGDSGLAIQLPALHFKRIDHIEVHQPYIEMAKQRFWVAKEVNYFHGDVRSHADTAFSGYDLVLAFDVLEHLPKQDALDFIECCPRMLVFIPIEDTPRCHREGADDIPSQDHLSTWTEQDFIDLGFETEVLPGFHREQGESWDALWAWRGI
jgi:glycosyltransferase involved in cell wall biosynthesis